MPIAATSSTGIARRCGQEGGGGRRGVRRRGGLVVASVSAGYHSWTGIRRSSRAASVATTVSVPTGNGPVGSGSEIGARPASAREVSGTGLNWRLMILPSPSTVMEMTVWGSPGSGVDGGVDRRRRGGHDAEEADRRGVTRLGEHGVELVGGHHGEERGCEVLLDVGDGDGQVSHGLEEPGQSAGRAGCRGSSRTARLLPAVPPPAAVSAVVAVGAGRVVVSVVGRRGGVRLAIRTP